MVMYYLVDQVSDLRWQLLRGAGPSLQQPPHTPEVPTHYCVKERRERGGGDVWLRPPLQQQEDGGVGSVGKRAGGKKRKQCLYPLV